MTKYESLWVPVDRDEFGDFFDPLGNPVKSVDNVIVLTIEEARDMFRAGMAHGVRPYDTESWDDYLTSKGIQI